FYLLLIGKYGINPNQPCPPTDATVLMTLILLPDYESFETVDSTIREILDKIGLNLRIISTDHSVDDNTGVVTSWDIDFKDQPLIQVSINTLLELSILAVDPEPFTLWLVNELLCGLADITTFDIDDEEDDDLVTYE